MALELSALLYIFGDLVTFSVALIALCWSLEAVLISTKFGPVMQGLRMRQVWFRSAAPIGFMLFIFRLVLSFLRDLSDAVSSAAVESTKFERLVVRGSSRPYACALAVAGAFTGILIAAGCVMEKMLNIVLLAPILQPLADNIGMNETQFSIMVITALGLGFITPPLGLNLFVVSGLTAEPIPRIAWRAVPFMFFILLVTLCIAHAPVISTTMLPDI